MQRLLKINLRLRRIVLATSRMDRMLALSCFFSVAIVLLRVLYTGVPTFLFLIWNLFLAWIPYLITKTMMCRIDWLEGNMRFATGFAVWLLFIPNSFYIITDLFHLEERGVPLWFDLVLIFSFAWNGLMLGVHSIQRMEFMIRLQWNISSEWIFVIPVMALNALGIYIGRYLRYNSWDVITNPWSLSEDMLFLVVHPFRNRFDWSMIACYSILLSIVYASVQRMKEAE